MTIRRRLWLILAIVALMAVLRAGLVLTLDRARQEAADYEVRASNIQTLVFQLGIVTLDYRLNQEERPLLLIRRKLDQLGEELALLPAGEPTDRALVTRLGRDFSDLRANVEKLAAAHVEQAAPRAGYTEPLVAADPRSPVYRLANRLSAEANDLAAGARTLLDRHRERSRHLAALTEQTIHAFDLVTALLVLGLLITQSRSVLRSLDALRQGARALAAGTAGARVKIAARDELGDLAETFNEMAAQLEQRQGQLEALHRHLADLNQDLERRVDLRTAELTAAITQRQATIAELNRSNAELRQFAYVASHDLQEPLRMVASYTDLLQRRHGDGFDAEGRRYLGYAIEGARRMQGLILDLLAYSRLGAPDQPLVAMALDGPLDAALADLRLSIAETGAVIDRGPLPTVLADAGQLHRLFLNLIGNALRFCGPTPPRIAIDAVREEQGGWRVSIRDQGIGIAPEHHERIFGLFQRLHPRSEYPGTGIGLAVCRRIVERHGGRIWVESSPGAGATFYFTLPAAAHAPPPGAVPTAEDSP